MDNKRDVFISYSSKNSEKAEQVRYVLEVNGIRCWMAPESIPAGSDYTHAIPKAIRQCKVVVLLLSENAQKSQWVIKELNFALSEKKTIVPFEIENCRLTSAFDFLDEQEERIKAYGEASQSFEKLVLSVKSLIDSDAPIEETAADDNGIINPFEDETKKRRKAKLNKIKRYVFRTLVIFLIAAGALIYLSDYVKSFIASRQEANTVTGITGECIWELNLVTGELKVSGDGATDDYTSNVYDPAPWNIYKASIKSVSVQNGVTRVGDYAFYNLYRATQVKLPKSLESIGEDTLYLCRSLSDISVARGNKSFASVDGNLYSKDKTVLIQYAKGKDEEEFSVPDSVTTIGSRAFGGCEFLTDIKLSNKVKTVEDSAFEGCVNIESITLPDSAENIGADVFLSCKKLAQIKVGKNNGRYSSPDGNLYSKNVDEMICYASGKTESSFNIPDTVKHISDGAFKNCAVLSSVTIPDGALSIGDCAFENCKGLKEITIPDSVKTIGSRAFAHCEDLRYITIPKSVESVGDEMSVGCVHLSDIYVDGENRNYASVDGVLFNKTKSELIQYPSGKQKTAYTVLNGVSCIKKGAFAYAGMLKNTVIPDSVKSIEDGAFAACISLVSLTVPESVASVGEEAFCCCDSLLEVNLPSGLKSISEGMFAECTSLSEVTLPDGIESIGEYAFSECDSLTYIVIPDSVKTIGESAFCGCEKLSRVTVPNTVENIEKYAFGYCLDKDNKMIRLENYALLCGKDSAAEAYANSNGISFAYSD